MPKLRDYREAHYSNTAKISDGVRTLAITAIGLVWLFKKQVGDNYEIPHELFLPVTLVFIAMAIDFAQYFYGSVAWYCFFRSKEKQNTKEDDELQASNYINFPTYFLFYSKVLTLGAAYYFLLSFMYHQIRLV